VLLVALRALSGQVGVLDIVAILLELAPIKRRLSGQFEVLDIVAILLEFAPVERRLVASRR
jgi:hypothetical protein